MSILYADARPIAELGGHGDTETKLKSTPKILAAAAAISSDRSERSYHDLTELQIGIYAAVAKYSALIAHSQTNQL